jgi:hypothetical protein
MLSKSRITRGFQCEKSLWLSVHKPELMVVSDSQQAIFTAGHNVGELAQQYFPGGELALTGDRPDAGAIERTKELIAQGVQTIYEATFVYDNTLVAVDILTCIDGKWNLFECKSTTQVKPQHVTDVAVQYYVVEGSGLPLGDVSVMHLNNQYVRRGDLDVLQLFSHASVLEQAKALQPFVKENIISLLEMLGKDEPQIEMGVQCDNPYTCFFKEYCHSLQTPVQEQEQSVTDNTPIIHSEEIRKRIESFGYPVYYFDFETFQSAIPMFDESRSYQQIPFQYSLHYRATIDSTPEHTAFLAWPEGDPRKALIKQLINDTYRPGKILVYNITFERTRLREFVRDFPEYKAELSGIIERLEDMMPIFRQKEFYFPSMGRGYSIKIVTPLLTPELSYDNLEISNGGDASSQFAQLYNTTDQQLITQTRNALLKYCFQDTWAMVRILEELEAL